MFKCWMHPYSGPRRITLPPCVYSSTGIGAITRLPGPPWIFKQILPAFSRPASESVALGSQSADRQHWRRGGTAREGAAGDRIVNGKPLFSNQIICSAAGRGEWNSDEGKWSNGVESRCPCDHPFPLFPSNGHGTLLYVRRIRTRLEILREPSRNLENRRRRVTR